SSSGGETAGVLDRPGRVDHHARSIGPANPDRMLQGNHGGAYPTQDAGKTWSWFNSLPIEQFYMVAADNNVPYNLCGGLQDNNGWCGASSGPSGSLNGSEWFTVTGGDGEYVVPAPSDSTIVYAESQNGNLQRIDLHSGVTRAVRPYAPGVSRSEEHTSELQSLTNVVCRLLLEKKNKNAPDYYPARSSAEADTHVHSATV